MATRDPVAALVVGLTRLGIERVLARDRALVRASDVDGLAELRLDPPLEPDVADYLAQLGALSAEWTLEELADRHDLSRESVRQIERKALRKLRAALAGAL